MKRPAITQLRSVGIHNATDFYRRGDVYARYVARDVGRLGGWRIRVNGEWFRGADPMDNGALWIGGHKGDTSVVQAWLDDHNPGQTINLVKGPFGTIARDMDVADGWARARAKLDRNARVTEGTIDN